MTKAIRAPITGTIKALTFHSLSCATPNEPLTDGDDADTQEFFISRIASFCSPIRCGHIQEKMNHGVSGSVIHPAH